MRDENQFKSDRYLRRHTVKCASMAADSFGNYEIDMKISQAGIELIKRFEGCRLEAYQDSVGVWTIGYGSTYWPDGRRVKQGDRLASEVEAEQLLRDALKTYEAGVNRLVKVHITQNQFDALVSFTYNLGVGALEKSTLIRKLNHIDIIPVANEFSRWTKAGGKELEGLRRRRAAERELFLK